MLMNGYLTYYFHRQLVMVPVSQNDSCLQPLQFLRQTIGTLFLLYRK